MFCSSSRCTASRWLHALSRETQPHTSHTHLTDEFKLLFFSWQVTETEQAGSSTVQTPSSPELRQRRPTAAAAAPAHTQSPASPAWPPAAMYAKEELLHLSKVFLQLQDTSSGLLKKSPVTQRRRLTGSHRIWRCDRAQIFRFDYKRTYRKQFTSQCCYDFYWPLHLRTICQI